MRAFLEALLRWIPQPYVNEDDPEQNWPGVW